MKRLTSYILILVAAIALTPCLQAVPYTVILDAGHGGRDAGCLGKNSKEKDITLKVVKLLGAMIKEKYGDEVRVIYTRLSDSYISLDERCDIANRNKGSLFISVHINSLDKNTRGRQSMQGAMVYVNNLFADNLPAITQRTVTEINSHGDCIEQPYNPSSAESQIAYDLMQSGRERRSVLFASLAQQQLVRHAHRIDRGVRSAGYRVLVGTRMPAALVELDYICNPDIEKYLNSKKGQQECAEALFQAFNKYYKLCRQ